MEDLQFAVRLVVGKLEPRVKIFGPSSSMGRNRLDPLGPRYHPANFGIKAGSCSDAGKSDAPANKIYVLVEAESEFVHFASTGLALLLNDTAINPVASEKAETG